ncbi:uncharacterized protein LOC117338450 [Pecten maximus]|uniref:uncharacterized protein LOC117338450 n=1 Tax=Pecten maximus TaxID=6579 RepID=UPI0014591646|nr:uncharacterized protein LOC117338450 [Pecten maximus]
MESVTYAYPPTRQKRQLTFLSSNLNWNDASLYCSQEHGGSLLEHSSHATEEMVSRYSNGIWSGRWGNDYWLGLYIQDMSGPVYEWDGTCEVASTNSYNHFEGSPPSSGDLDSTKKCAVAKKDTLEWRFEKCSIEYVAICQTILGQCTYERDIPVGACVTVTVNSLKITAADRDACEAYCSSINADDQANGECWAVTFYTTTKYCAPSISRKPYDFDTSGSKYSSSCNDNSLVSWKRCFEGNISLEEKIARLQEELTVDIKQTSSYIRKHISASDERPSAKGIGMVLGAGMLKVDKMVLSTQRMKVESNK